MPYEIDWTATGSMLSGLGALLTAATALYALLHAYPEWVEREQYRRKAEKAEKILTCFYEGEQCLRSIRSPLLLAAELEAARKALGDASMEFGSSPSNKEVEREVYQDRFSEHKKYWERLYAMFPIAKLSFDTVVYDSLKVISDVANEVLNAAQSLPNISEEDASTWRGILIHTGGPDDKITSRIKSAEAKLVDALGEYCR